MCGLKKETKVEFRPEIKPESLCEFYFNIEEIPIISLEYNCDLQELEIYYKVNNEEIGISSHCSKETYFEYLTRLKQKTIDEN